MKMRTTVQLKAPYRQLPGLVGWESEEVQSDWWGGLAPGEIDEAEIAISRIVNDGSRFSVQTPAKTSVIIPINNIASVEIEREAEDGDDERQSEWERKTGRKTGTEGPDAADDGDGTDGDPRPPYGQGQRY